MIFMVSSAGVVLSGSGLAGVVLAVGSAGLPLAAGSGEALLAAVGSALGAGLAVSVGAGLALATGEAGADGLAGVSWAQACKGKAATTRPIKKDFRIFMGIELDFCAFPELNNQ